MNRRNLTRADKIVSWIIIGILGSIGVSTLIIDVIAEAIDGYAPFWYMGVFPLIGALPSTVYLIRGPRAEVHRGRLRAQQWRPTDPEAAARYKKVAEERAAIKQFPSPRRQVRPVTHFPVPESWEDAERFAALWLVHHGHAGTRVTSGGADGGIDVVGPTVVGQVKHHGRPVGAPDVQRLAGAASAPRYVGRTRVFFSTRGFTPQGLRAGQELGVQLYAHTGSDWRRVG